MTAERFLSVKDVPPVDFYVIDEFYKLGDLQGDETRAVALNEALYRLRKSGGQFYFLGPSMTGLPKALGDAYSCHVMHTNYATVAVDVVKAAGDGKEISRLLSVVRSLSGPTIVYCSSPDRANIVARDLANLLDRSPVASLKAAHAWVSGEFHPDWVFAQCLRVGVGVHHARIPRSLLQFAIRAFNAGRIDILVCTSTIIEGVNTCAKNVLVWDSKIATTPLDYFTFANIRGRSGRMFYHHVGRVVLFDDPPGPEDLSIDIPLLTQGSDAPDSLLIQIDEDDLSFEASARVDQVMQKSILSIDVLRANHSIDPSLQIEMAKEIASNMFLLHDLLSWRKVPDYRELLAVCDLFWRHLLGNPRKLYGIGSSKHLAYRTLQLLKNRDRDMRWKINNEMSGDYPAQNVDDAVQRVLEFERRWAGFQLPRMLMAVSVIQESVFRAAGMPYGDYSFFASAVESLFRGPVVAALEEYGVPGQITAKIFSGISRRGRDIDAALDALRSLDIDSLRLSSFEKEIIHDAKKGLGG